MKGAAGAFFLPELVQSTCVGRHHLLYLISSLCDSEHHGANGDSTGASSKESVEME